MGVAVQSTKAIQHPLSYFSVTLPQFTKHIILIRNITPKRFGHADQKNQIFLTSFQMRHFPPNAL